MSPPDTKNKILDAAEKLFAEHGLEATSLRMITQEADVNLAAVNYHFGSKEALQVAIFERCLNMINTERLVQLTALENESGDGPLSLEAVLRTLMGPPLLMKEFQSDRGKHLLQIAGMLHCDQSEERQKFMENTFREMRQRFTRAFQRALPDLSLEDIYWRAHFVIGSMVHTLTWCRNMCGTELFPFPAPTPEALLEQLVLFTAAGMKAAPHVTGGKE